MKKPGSFHVQTGTFEVNQPDVELKKQQRAVKIDKPQEEGTREAQKSRLKEGAADFILKDNS